MKQVYVGMSGGVDSSVTAALMKQAGYQVTGVYMKNWSQDLPGFTCPWKEDYQDAKRVAVQLDIPFKLYDFESQYRELVVQYLLDGYRSGITPNPDIMCNQEIKFKLFLDTAVADGADMIATGHYARIQKDVAKPAKLLVGLDANKDQSYFLYRVPEAALSRSLMPIGDLKKPAVREMARALGLATADKKDSQGICFVGKVGIKEFLLAELGPQPHGNIITRDGQIIGEHDGALFYTIGQRHGLDVGGGLPYYVIGKDMDNNEVYVTTDLNDSTLWRKSLEFTAAHWIGETGSDPQISSTVSVRTRYRAPLIQVTRLTRVSKSNYQLELAEAVQAVTAGQSAVLYDNGICLGGGIVI